MKKRRILKLAEDNKFGLDLSSGGATALYRITTLVGKIEAIAMVRWKKRGSPWPKTI